MVEQNEAQTPDTSGIGLAVKTQIVLETFKSRVAIRDFLKEIDIHQLTEINKLTGDVIAEIKNQESAAKAGIDAVIAHLESINGTKLSKEDALAILKGEVIKEAEPKAKKKSAAASNEHKYKLVINNNTYEKAGISNRGLVKEEMQKDLDAAKATKDEKWKFIVKEELDRFFTHLDAGEYKWIETEAAYKHFNRSKKSSES